MSGKPLPGQLTLLFEAERVPLWIELSRKPLKRRNLFHWRVTIRTQSHTFPDLLVEARYVAEMLAVCEARRWECEIQASYQLAGPSDDVGRSYERQWQRYWADLMAGRPRWSAKYEKV